MRPRDYWFRYVLWWFLLHLSGRRVNPSPLNIIRGLGMILSIFLLQSQYTVNGLPKGKSTSLVAWHRLQK